MRVARKKKAQTATEVSPQPRARSGEHVISLDEQIRRQFERAFENDLQTTSQVSKFELEDMLAKPEARPSHPPIVGMPIVNVVAEDYEAIAIGTLPPPAVEIDRTKEEERDP